MQWDSAAYLRFKAERTQPSIDLVKRIDLEQPRKLLDVGCGPGNSTQVLADAFPNALRIIGIDSSPEMIEAAKDDHPTWSSGICDALNLPSIGEDGFDVVFSNACIQWVPDHPRLIRDMARPSPPRRNARRAGSHELSGAHPPDHRGTCRLGRVARRTRLRAGSSIRFPKRPISTSSPPKPDSSRCGRSPISTVCRPTRPSWIGIKARDCAPT